MNVLARIQRGLMAYARHVAPTATVVWSRGEYPEAAAADVLIAVQLTTGPTPPANGTSDVLPVPTRLRARFAAGSGPAVLSVAGVRWAVDAPGGAVAGDTRDALAAAIGSDPPLLATVTADGTDSLVLEGELGNLYPYASRGLVSLEVEAQQLAHVDVGDETASIGFQVFTASTSLRSSATATAHTLRKAMRSPTARRILGAYGVAFIDGPGRIVDLDFMAGPVWASRSALSMTVSAVSVTAEPVDTIDALALELTARGPLADHVATVVASS